jgi:hypothetical protein
MKIDVLLQGVCAYFNQNPKENLERWKLVENMETLLQI